MFCFFFFNDTATTEIYTLSLHDALPISRRGEHQGQGVLGGRDRVALGSVGDKDAALGRCLYIYVVHPDAGPSDGLEVLCPLYDLRRDLRRAADYKSVVLPDPLEEPLLIQAKEDVHLEPFS